MPVTAANASHAMLAISPPISSRAVTPSGSRTATTGARGASIVDVLIRYRSRSAQHVRIDASGELRRVGAWLDHIHQLELIRIERDLRLELGRDRMVMMRVAAQHR